MHQVILRNNLHILIVTNIQYYWYKQKTDPGVLNWVGVSVSPSPCVKFEDEV